MAWKEKIARFLAPNMRTDDEIRSLVADEIKRAKAALPITANYDPNGEGYRPASSSVLQRNLQPIAQSRMFEIAYYMFDASPMFRRLAQMDKSFLFHGPITITADDDDLKNIINKFWNDPENRMDLKFPEKAMWYSILGEACWPVQVNKINGQVRLQYTDPSLIKDVWVNPLNIEQRMQVELQSASGRSGQKMAIIRRDYNIASKNFERLVGDCFFYRLNAPPNAARGRSDYLTLFDWIDSIERYGYNYLERAEFLLNFIWDVQLNGMNDDQIRDWLRDNPAPQPGAMRAHNENVTWQAVAPDLKASDHTTGFDMGKSFIMGAAGRPASWFGEGGKAYQTEAEQFGQVPIADLEDRQNMLKFILIDQIDFVIDQAVIAGMISPEKAASGYAVNMPEVSKKDLSKFVNGVPNLTTALQIAVMNKWVTRDEATKLFAFFVSYLGYEIDADAMIEEAAKAPKEDEVDYDEIIKDTAKLADMKKTTPGELDDEDE